MILFGHRLPGMSSLLVWGLLWELLGQLEVTFFLPPLSAGDFLICMGSSAGTGCGFAQTTDKKVISFIGDSTFFHSGIPGLINAVFNNHNFTLVILDNAITAMTGHQPNPGVDMEAMNLSGYGDNKGSGDVTIFRITARATGTSADSAEVILRTQYGRIF